ncbi:MAG: hypothetical protein KBD53_10530 [Candidatus Omnitrophica bacterium]|nr:hypothetical protein [Candidatus Omnitrophota bacterium]
MYNVSPHIKNKPGFKFSVWTVLFSFLFSLITPLPVSAQQTLFLPSPGVMLNITPAFVPPLLKGMKVDVNNPFNFDFILDSGNAELSQDELKQEADKLIKYFLASLTIPETDLWVNLSPYEKDRIIPSEFGITEMGRDLLAQDYILKQLTASLMYPEKDLGKVFWNKVYKKAQELYGTTDVPVNTFNKVWILPDKAVVYENGDKAFIVKSHLKVMLEEDYLAMTNNLHNKEIETNDLEKEKVKQLNSISSQMIKEVIIPEIEKEVNYGQNFSKLRQVYHSLILAKWYKESLKESIINRQYSDQKKTVGVDVDDKQAKEKIYEQYLKAFKDGVYNYIKDEYDPTTQEVIPRKYFSGGIPLMNVPLEKTKDSAMLTDPTGKLSSIKGVYSASSSKYSKLTDIWSGLTARINHVYLILMSSLTMIGQSAVPIVYESMYDMKIFEQKEKKLEVWQVWPYGMSSDIAYYQQFIDLLQRDSTVYLHRDLKSRINYFLKHRFDSKDRLGEDEYLKLLDVISDAVKDFDMLSKRDDYEISAVRQILVNIAVNTDLNIRDDTKRFYWTRIKLISKLLLSKDQESLEKIVNYIVAYKDRKIETPYFNELAYQLEFALYFNDKLSGNPQLSSKILDFLGSEKAFQEYKNYISMTPNFEERSVVSAYRRMIKHHTAQTMKYYFNINDIPTLNEKEFNLRIKMIGLFGVGEYRRFLNEEYVAGIKNYVLALIKTFTLKDNVKIYEVYNALSSASIEWINWINEDMKRMMNEGLQKMPNDFDPNSFIEVAAYFKLYDRFKHFNAPMPNIEQYFTSLKKNPAIDEDFLRKVPANNIEDFGLVLEFLQLFLENDELLNHFILQAGPFLSSEILDQDINQLETFRQKVNVVNPALGDRIFISVGSHYVNENYAQDKIKNEEFAQKFENAKRFYEAKEIHNKDIKGIYRLMGNFMFSRISEYIKANHLALEQTLGEDKLTELAEWLLQKGFLHEDDSDFTKIFQNVKTGNFQYIGHKIDNILPKDEINLEKNNLEIIHNSVDFPLEDAARVFEIKNKQTNEIIAQVLKVDSSKGGRAVMMADVGREKGGITGDRLAVKVEEQGRLIFDAPVSFTTGDAKPTEILIENGIIKNYLISTDEKDGFIIIYADGNVHVADKRDLWIHDIDPQIAPEQDRRLEITKKLDDYLKFLDISQKNKNSLVSNMLLYDGKEMALLNDEPNQRRLFVIFEDGHFGIINSNVSMSTDEAVRLAIIAGAKKVVYMDTGQFDYTTIRPQGKDPVVWGHSDQKESSNRIGIWKQTSPKDSTKIGEPQGDVMGKEKIPDAAILSAENSQDNAMLAQDQNSEKNTLTAEDLDKTSFDVQQNPLDRTDKLVRLTADKAARERKFSNISHTELGKTENLLEMTLKLVEEGTNNNKNSTDRLNALKLLIKINTEGLVSAKTAGILEKITTPLMEIATYKNNSHIQRIDAIELLREILGKETIPQEIEIILKEITTSLVEIATDKDEDFGNRINAFKLLIRIQDKITMPTAVVLTLEEIIPSLMETIANTNENQIKRIDALEILGQISKKSMPANADIELQEMARTWIEMTTQKHNTFNSPRIFLFKLLIKLHEKDLTPVDIKEITKELMDMAANKKNSDSERINVFELLAKINTMKLASIELEEIAKSLITIGLDESEKIKMRTYALNVSRKYSKKELLSIEAAKVEKIAQPLMEIVANEKNEIEGRIQGLELLKKFNEIGLFQFVPIDEIVEYGNDISKTEFIDNESSNIKEFLILKILARLSKPNPDDVKYILKIADITEDRNVLRPILDTLKIWSTDGSHVAQNYFEEKIAEILSRQPENGQSIVNISDRDKLFIEVIMESFMQESLLPIFTEEKFSLEIRSMVMKSLAKNNRIDPDFGKINDDDREKYLLKVSTIYDETGLVISKNLIDKVLKDELSASEIKKSWPWIMAEEPLDPYRNGQMKLELSKIEWGDGGDAVHNFHEIMSSVLKELPGKNIARPLGFPKQKVLDSSEISVYKVADTASQTVLIGPEKQINLSQLTNWFGRTLEFRNNDKIIHFKFLKKSEKADLLSYEHDMMDFLRSHKDQWGLQGEYPQGIIRIGRISVNDLPKEYLSDLEGKTKNIEVDTTGGFYTFMAYETVSGDKGNAYYTYLNDPDLSPEEFEEGLKINIHDRFVMARHGLFDMEIIELFHNQQEEESRRYDWMIDIHPQENSTRHGAGRLNDITGATLYPNIRLSGPADFAGIVFIDDLIEDKDNKFNELADSRINRLYDLTHGNEIEARKFIQAALLGDTLLSLALIIPTYYERRGELNYEKEKGNQPTPLQNNLRLLFEEAQKSFTGLNDLPKEITNLNIPLMAKQMAYFLTDQYIFDFIGRAGSTFPNNDIYPGTKIVWDDYYSQSPGWVEGRGWDYSGKTYAIPSRNPNLKKLQKSQDLGFFNGLNPLQEVIKGMYIGTTMMTVGGYSATDNFADSALLSADSQLPVKFEETSDANENNSIRRKNVGGIDFNLDLLELETQGRMNKFNTNQNFENIQIDDGLIPVIINITPITNLPLILGAVENTETQLSHVQ